MAALAPMVRMPIAEISQMELKYYIILAVEAMHWMAVGVNDQAMQASTGGWIH